MVTEFAISLLRITLSFFFSLRTFDSFWYDKQRHKSAYDTNPLERFFISTSSTSTEIFAVSYIPDIISWKVFKATVDLVKKIADSTT